MANKGCPFCDSGEIDHGKTCRCAYNHRKCTNGHEWYECKTHKNRVISGNPHGQVDVSLVEGRKAGCGCVKGRTYALLPVMLTDECIFRDS